MGRRFRATLNLGHTVIKGDIHEFNDDANKDFIEEIMTEAAEELMFKTCSDRYYEEVQGDHNIKTQYDHRDSL